MKPTSKRKSGPSGPTISTGERARRGYGNRLFSLPNETSELIDELASKLGKTRSGVLVDAVGEFARSRK